MTKITKLYKLTIIFLFSALFFSGTVFAQLSCPNAKRCTSGDLEVLGAYIDGVSTCFTCTPGSTVTRTLYLTILNKTGSVRTCFALFGTLHGSISSDGPQGFCGGIIPPNATTNVAVGTISFACGSALSLTDNFLAWTDAAGQTVPRCAEILADACKSIAPKCGTAAQIIIRTPLAVDTTASAKPCTGTSQGSLTFTATGGTPAISYSLTGGNLTNSVTANGVYTGLIAGSYTMTCTDANNCTATRTVTLNSKTCCVAPPKPTICETPASLCGDGTASLTISNAVVGDRYYVTQHTVTTSQVASSATLTFTGLLPGATDLSVYGVDVQSGTTCTGTAATCSDLTTCTPPSNVASRQQYSMVPTQTIILSESGTKVKAFPNPFNDRVKFSLQSAVSGQGSLELFNALGQKVKTIFQGYVEKGQVRTLEYNVPSVQRNTLIYIFKVGNQKSSGRLISL
ncbi:MAG: hypothetical protein ABJA57_11005 [Ginsengibacter sp.]